MHTAYVEERTIVLRVGESDGEGKSGNFAILHGGIGASESGYELAEET